MSADVIARTRDDEIRPGSSAVPAPALRGEGLRMDYRGSRVLEVEKIALDAGATYALLGASGAGKSTLLRVLGLLERPSAGSVFLDGRPADYRDLATRRTIAAVFQRPYLLRGDVAFNVAYGLRLRGVPVRECAAQVSAVLARVGMEGWEGRSALTLSGGEAQRVALARALVLEPRVLLLDEPLSYMDPLLKRQLTLEFAEILKSEHVTALYVTHDQDEAAMVADRIGIMRSGRIVAEGVPDEVLTLAADSWVASFTGVESPLSGRVAAVSEGTMTIETGPAQVFAAGAIPPGEEVLFGIRPEDVLLFEPGVRLPLTSARNQLEATVVELGPSGTAVRVVLSAHGLRFASSVSRASAASLGLRPGASVTALFKATAVRVRRRATLDAREDLVHRQAT